MSDPSDVQVWHPNLAAWYAQVRDGVAASKGAPGLDAGNSNHVDDLRLLGRLAWACGPGRLTPRSFGEALDRALHQAVQRQDGRVIADVTVSCDEPGLLPQEWIESHGGPDIVTSTWEQRGLIWTKVDFDLVLVFVEVGGASDPWTELTGRAYAAPEGFTTAQARWYDVLRSDGLPPDEAARRVQPPLLSRTRRLRHGGFRFQRRRIRRYPLPHPVLVRWLKDVRANSDPDTDLIRQLEWATGRTGCLTEDAYEQALQQVIVRARAAGRRSRNLTVGCVRSDLLPHRSQPWILATRGLSPDSTAIDCLMVYAEWDDEPIGTAYVCPVALGQQAAMYEQYRAEGLDMIDAYRRIYRYG